MFRKTIIFFFFLSILFADYNNITLSQLLKKVALLNNINIIFPSTLETNLTYTFTINNFITAKDLLKASEALLKKQGYKLSRLNKSFFIVEKIKDKRYKYLYRLKNSNADIVLKRIKKLYPGQIYKISNKFILIKYSNKKQLLQIINNIKKLDYTPSAYYVQLNIYNTDTNSLNEIGVNINNLNINKDEGTILLNKTFTPNLLPALITLLNDKQKSTLIASPKLFLAPDTNNSAEFKEVTTIPITIKKTQIIPGTNPVVTNTDETIYKDVGLMLTLKFINTTQDNKVEFLLKLTDSNIINYTENGITSSSRQVNAIIEAQLNHTIFIAGLSKKTTIHRIVGIPILKDIPLLKYIFSKKKAQQQNRTLVVTIRITKVKYGLAHNK